MSQDNPSPFITLYYKNSRRNRSDQGAFTLVLATPSWAIYT